MEETKFILVRSIIEGVSSSFRIEKRDGFDLENYAYLTTNKNSSIAMNEYCLKEDYEYFKKDSE